MKNLDCKELKQALRHNYISLIFGILFLTTSLGLIYFGYQAQHASGENYIPMKELEGDLEKLEGKNAYIDVALPPFLFAKYQDGENEPKEKFYLAMDKDNFLYIIYMHDDTYEKLKNIKDKPVKLTGVTEEITSDIKSLAIESYNKELGEEYLTEENFPEFVGLVYLNTMEFIDNSPLYYLLSLVSFCIFIVFITVYISLYLKSHKSLKKYSKEELDKISMQIYGIVANPYQELKLYLTKDYLIDLSDGIVILKYEDIIWAYPYEYRYNGLLVNKNIKIVDKNNLSFDISNTKLIRKDKEKTIDEVLKKLKQKNKNIIIGYNKETKKMLKEQIKKEKKAKNKEKISKK